MLISAQRETIQEVPQWIYQNQLSRRNLTDEQRGYLIGKQYEHRKKRAGEHTGNQYTKMEIGQNVPIPTDEKSREVLTASYIGPVLEILLHNIPLYFRL